MSLTLDMMMARLAGGLTTLVIWVVLLPLALRSEPVRKLPPVRMIAAFHLLSTPNIPPEVSIVFPPERTQFHIATPVHIRARATDPDGTIEEVRFFVGTNLIGIATNAPYEAVSYPSQRVNVAGPFTAVAVDNEGASTTSDPVRVGFALHINGDGFQLLDRTGDDFSRKVRVAPATFEVQALLTTSDGVGNPVDFYLETNKVGTVVDPPYILSVTNVPAGEYNVRVGTTNRDGVYSLYPVIQNYDVLYVLDPLLRQPSRPDTTSFTFDFTGTLPYETNIIERSSDLRTWFPVATNVSTTNSFFFQDNAATESFRFYRMKVFTWQPWLP